MIDRERCLTSEATGRVRMNGKCISQHQAICAQHTKQLSPLQEAWGWCYWFWGRPRRRASTILFVENHTAFRHDRLLLGTVCAAGRSPVLPLPYEQPSAILCYPVLSRLNSSPAVGIQHTKVIRPTCRIPRCDILFINYPTALSNTSVETSMNCLRRSTHRYLGSQIPSHFSADERPDGSTT